MTWQNKFIREKVPYIKPLKPITLFEEKYYRTHVINSTIDIVVVLSEIFDWVFYTAITEHFIIDPIKRCLLEQVATSAIKAIFSKGRFKIQGTFDEMEISFWRGFGYTCNDNYGPVPKLLVLGYLDRLSNEKKKICYIVFTMIPVLTVC